MRKINLDSLFFRAKALNDIKDSCLVVVDTNVLLCLVMHKGGSGEEVLERLGALAEEKRLLLPAQVIEEFRRGVPHCVRSILKEIDDYKSKLPSIQQPGDVNMSLFDKWHALPKPTVQALQDGAKALMPKAAADAYSQRRKDLIEALDTAKQHLLRVFECPCDIEGCKVLFQKALWDKFTDEELRAMPQEARDRYDEHVPPGYADDSKRQNKYGDYAIWKSILQIGAKYGKDLVLVTEEMAKDDWVECDSTEKNQRRPVCARHELVEEYYQHSRGGTFGIINLETFLKEFVGPTAEDVVSEYESSLARVLYATGPTGPFLPAGTLAWYLEQGRSTVTTTTTTTTRAPEPQGAYLGSWTGTGPKTTESFTTVGEWELSYQKQAVRAWNFKIRLFRRGETIPLETLVDINERAAAGTTRVYHTGQLYLKIEPAQPQDFWSVGAQLIA